MSQFSKPRMSFRPGLFRFCLVMGLITVLSSGAAPKANCGKIELIRDTWGIPHVFADTDAGAMYGLGYATAEERGFQMTYNLRIIQGRLAEIVGARPRGNRNETAVDNDRKMRTFGWGRAAERTAANLDRGTRQLLEAYCDGVNDSFAAQQAAGKLHPLFQQLGVEPETWKPADCLLSWWHLAQFFATDGTRDLMVLRNRLNPRPGQPQPFKSGPLWFDDTTAVVQRSDVSDAWVKRVEKFQSAHGLGAVTNCGVAPKFSHAWVVCGNKTTTGAAVLVSDPQTPVRNPSLWMEFHISGKTINARGIGVPGSPGLLIGFTRNVAWGLTALGADQADLFRLETDNQRPDEYRWNGKWQKMEVRTEQIKVKGAPAVEIKLRETHLGPVASEFCFRQPGDPEVALKRIPLCEPDRDTIRGVFAMMRARSAKEFTKALGDWRFPSANCVYGDSAGHIGYSTLGAVPRRSKRATDSNGNEAMTGAGDLDDWQGFVPQDLLPQLFDPKAGWILSANHRPVGSFYQIPLGISTGSMGDTLRSWRLRERLQALPRFTPAQVLEIHEDAVNPARRNIVRLGLHLRDTTPGGLSYEATNALAILEPWLKNGASSDLNVPGAQLATRISTFFRFTATPLTFRFGGGESGLARFLKAADAEIAAKPNAEFDEEVWDYIDTVLANAWEDYQTAPNATPRPKLGWFDSLDGFGSLDESGDLRQAEIAVLDGQTLHSQAAQSYTQWVPLDNVDAAQTICPIGHSDRQDNQYRTSTMKLWERAELHPAPLSRAAVDKVAARRTILSGR